MGTNFSSVSGTVTHLQAKVKLQQGLLIGVVVVLGVMIVGLVLDSIAEKKAISLDMRDKIMEQNLRVEDLTKEVRKLSERSATQKK